MHKVVCCLVALLLNATMVAAEDGELAVAARPHFSVHPIRIHENLNTEGLARNAWHKIRSPQESGGYLLIFVDLKGRAVEQQISSRRQSCPVDLSIRNGKLLIRDEGCTYRYEPRGHEEQRLILAPVTRHYCTPFGGNFVATSLELVATRVFIEDTQWVVVFDKEKKEAQEISPTPVEAPMLPLPDSRGPAWLKGTIEPYEKEVEEIVPASPKLDVRA